MTLTEKLRILMGKFLRYNAKSENECRRSQNSVSITSHNQRRYFFILIHGPRDWKAFWLELTNPPKDARHAIRKTGLPRFGIYRYQSYKMQYQNYVKSVEKSLTHQLKDQKSRLELVRRFFGGLNMAEEHAQEIGYILASFNMYDIKPSYQNF
uniref:LAGLIDADG homing endonuclease n=1 Tax=Ditylenchus dipsaci TaxID=166011 RepID=A0A915DCG1_9BILA